MGQDEPEEPDEREPVERDERDEPDERGEVERPPEEPVERDAVERVDFVPDAVERVDFAPDEDERVDFAPDAVERVAFAPDEDDFAREAVLRVLAAAGRPEAALPDAAEEALLRPVDGFPLPDSSAVTRRASASISLRSPRTSSRTRRSSIVSRTRAAAWAISSTRSRVRFCVPAAPSAVAWNVRSTAPRTASTASAAPEPCLSFFFLSFLAMAQL
jgi:hypothetical protein